MMKWLKIVVLLISLPVNARQLKVAGEKVELNKLNDLDGVIWAFEFISDTDAILTLRKGEIYRYNLKTNQARLIKGAPVVATDSQGGLLDILPHPNFKENRILFLTYSKKISSGKTTALAKANLEGDELKNLKDVFVAKAVSDENKHYGSRLAFDKQGLLYMTVGDRGLRDQAQNLNVHNGKLLRLTQEGKPAPGNPFLSRKKALPEIYSYGHRNPQGLDIDNDVIWLMEHGPRGGDEINRIVAGKNYGWPVITYGKEYWGPSIGGTHKKGMEQPFKYFVPSIAPCGLMVYSGRAFKSWKGALFSGALKLTHLNMVKVQGEVPGEEFRLFEYLGQRVRDVTEDNSGFIYFTTDAGHLYQIRPQKK